MNLKFPQDKVKIGKYLFNLPERETVAISDEEFAARLLKTKNCFYGNGDYKHGQVEFVPVEKSGILPTCYGCGERVWPWQQSGISFTPIHKKCHRNSLRKFLKEYPSMAGAFQKEMFSCNQHGMHL